MRPTRIVLIFLLVTAHSALGDVRLITRVLSNGMTVVLGPDVRAETIAIHLTVDAGSRHDASRRHGTAALGSRVIGARLPQFRSDLNQERSLFAAEVTASNLPGVLEQISEAMRNHAVAAGELTRIREQMIREIGQRTATHDPLPGQLLLHLVYGEHPHGHEPWVSPKRVGRSDVERFLRANYGPESSVIAIAGTFDEEAVMSMMQAAFGSLRPSRARERCKPYPVELSRGLQREIRSRSTRLTEIHIGYPTVASGHPDWYALNILADIIGQGPKSRLQAALVATKLATDFAEGEAESPCAASLLRMRVRVAPDVPTARVLAVMDEELDRISREPVSEAELVLAREQETKWAEEQLSTNAGVAGAAARTALFYRGTDRTNHEVRSMSAVSAEDVRRVAERYLQPSSRALVIVKPVD